MEINVQLPDGSVLTEGKVKKIDTLCAVIPPKELREFYQLHQLEMALHTPEEMEMGQAVADLLDILSSET